MIEKRANSEPLRKLGHLDLDSLHGQSYLKKMASPQDRGRAMDFVGRDDVVRHLMSQIEESRGEVPENATTVIYGPAGAGKTCIMKEIPKMIAGQGRYDAKGFPHAKVIDAKHTVMASEEAVVMAIAEAEDIEDQFLTATSLRRGFSGEGRLGIGGIGGSASAEEERGTVTSAPFPTFKGLKAKLGEKADATAYLLCVDEIQLIEPFASSQKTAELVVSLHESKHELRIIPIYAGLGNTLDVLKKAGLYRNSTKHKFGLEALHEEEVSDLLNNFLARAKTRHSKAERGRWEKWLQAESEGWPQHVRVCLEALARELLQVGNDLGRADMKLAASRTRASRQEFYEETLGSTLRKAGNIHLLASCMQEIARKNREDPHSLEEEHHLIALIEGQMQKMEPTKMRVTPESRDPDKFFLLMKEKGCISKTREGGWRCPIPSYETSVVNRVRERTSMLSTAARSADFKDFEEIESEPGVLAAHVPSEQLTAGGRLTMHSIPRLSHDEQRLIRIHRVLRKVGESCHAPDDNGVTPLHEAARGGKAKLCGAMLAAEGFRQTHRNMNGRTPLHDAVDSGDPETVKALADAAAKAGGVNFPDHNRNTALHLAGKTDHTELVRLLVAGGADMRLKTADMIPGEELAMERDEDVEAALKGMRDDLACHGEGKRRPGSRFPSQETPEGRSMRGRSLDRNP